MHAFSSTSHRRAGPWQRHLLALGIQGACLLMAQTALAQQGNPPAEQPKTQAQTQSTQAQSTQAQQAEAKRAAAEAAAPTLPTVQVTATADLEPGASTRIEAGRWSRPTAWPT